MTLWQKALISDSAETGTICVCDVFLMCVDVCCVYQSLYMAICYRIHFCMTPPRINDTILSYAEDLESVWLLI